MVYFCLLIPRIIHTHIAEQSRGTNQNPILLSFSSDALASRRRLDPAAGSSHNRISATVPREPGIKINAVAQPAAANKPLVVYYYNRLAAAKQQQKRRQRINKQIPADFNVCPRRLNRRP